MNEFDKKRTDELRNLTGKITSTDPLVDFFYLLMRDELPVGKVERLVRDSINPPGQEETVFTNGWLAQYAKNLVDMIRHSKSEDLLKEILEEKSLDGEDMINLEQEIIKECETHQEEKSVSSTIEDTKNVVEQLRISGGLSKEEAERIVRELGEIEREETDKTNIEADHQKLESFKEDKND